MFYSVDAFIDYSPATLGKKYDKYDKKNCITILFIYNSKEYYWRLKGKSIIRK